MIGVAVVGLEINMHFIAVPVTTDDVVTTKYINVKHIQQIYQHGSDVVIEFANGDWLRVLNQQAIDIMERIHVLLTK